ncbi:MAG: hypothetical protein A2Z40_04365 [Deltaproteobacteria bacterium RBG_19FT_COMBO_60_16]|nr:MAG: hypothetical protein A2Z40_04365 [Deltaproteobacteria bacterium RBG_19FT_COMBO_60_16]
MPERRWLILSYFSNIDGMACAQHLDDRISHLEQAGIRPVLLTGPCGVRWDTLPHARAPSVAPSGVRFEIRHFFRKMRFPDPWSKVLEFLALLPLYPFYLLEKIIADLDSQWSWFPLAAIRGYFLCRKHRPEILYSTGGPSSAPLAAGLFARRCSVPWIAEVQDPLVHEDWLRSRRALAVYRWVERFICRRADAVVFVTDAARRRAESRTDTGGRGWVVYPGADPATASADPLRKGDRCRFAHFGSLGGSRNIETFLGALGLLFRESPGMESAAGLDLYGTCDRRSKALIRKFSSPGVITVHGRLPRKESLAAMQRSDVLLLIQNTEEFSVETIPSKVYEYLQAGRPILGLVYRNPELAGMLIAQGHMAVDAADPGAVKEGITRCLARWRESAPEGPALPPSSYTVAAAVGRLVAISGDLRERRTSGEGTDG